MMKAQINKVRGEILSVEREVQSLKSWIASADLNSRTDLPADLPPGTPAADRGEMLANATLAYRHLEDARMRLGKVIQAYDGGISVYDKNQHPKSPVDLGGAGRFG